jgi:hypothetical protein
MEESCPCGVGVEYLLPDPASRRGDEKGSLKSDSVKYCHERKTTLARASSIYKKQTCPLVREGASEKEYRNSERVINIWP